jgi:hypothetical protein
VRRAACGSMRSAIKSEYILPHARVLIVPCFLHYECNVVCGILSSMIQEDRARNLTHKTYETHPDKL